MTKQITAMILGALLLFPAGVYASPMSSASSDSLHYAQNYDEIYDVFNSINNYWDYEATYEADTEMAAAVTGTPKTDAAGTADYTDTNLRHENVLEPDSIKTDGTWIYVLQKDHSVAILKTNPDGTVSLESRISEDTGESLSYPATLQEFYYDRDHLYLIYTGYHSGQNSSMTTLCTYDITDRQSPVYLSQISQSGYYLQSRVKDGYLYLFSRFDAYVYENKEDLDSYIPYAGDQMLTPEQICIPQIRNQQDFLVVTSLSMEQPDVFLDQDAILSGGTDFYVSEDNLYVMNASWQNQTSTEIVKLHYEQGQVDAKVSCKVRGQLNDSFSIDEYQGTLRVLTTYEGASSLFERLFENTIGTTASTRKNALYLLDEDLNITGRLMGIAKNESIRSARFLGDTAYFVTFENHDPLFTADLSDPSAPKLTGSLVLSGFSSYLHPFGEDRLVGLGYEADKYGTITGVKLSLFDTSDPSQVKEITRYVMDGLTTLNVLDDYRQIYVQPEKGLLGFYVNTHYFLFSVTDREITPAVLYDLYSDQIYTNGDSWWSSDTAIRGISIEDLFYVAGDGFVTSFDLGTFEKRQHVTFE